MKKFLTKMFLFIFIGLVIYLAYNIFYESNFHKNYGVSKATENSKKIGTVSIFSSPVSLPSLKRLTGHSWIYVYNTSDEVFEINGIDIPPNKGVSFGTTANTEFSTRGIWVNVEGYNYYYKDNIALSGDLYAEDLDYIETYLKHHDKWNIFFNCSTFATLMWNGLYAGQNNQLKGITPIGLYHSIRHKDDYSVNQEYSIFGGMFPYLYTK